MSSPAFTKQPKAVSNNFAAPIALPSYSFLAYPPQKQAPTQPLPTTPKANQTEYEKPVTYRRRESVFASITTWVANVEPGTPLPYSPPADSRSTHSTRRASVGTAIISPVTGNEDYRSELRSLGYTSAFLNYQDILLPPRTSTKRKSESKETLTSTKEPALNKSPSFGFLRPARHRRSSSYSAVHPATGLQAASENMPSASSHSRTHSVASTVTKSKKAKYAKQLRPPPLAVDLALAQFADGGNVEDHIRSYNHAKAKSQGAAKADGHLVGVGDVWRDGEGGVWRDQEEQWEFAHLLSGEKQAGPNGWVQFGSNGKAANVAGTADDEERRGSVSTQASQDSDLDPRYAMQADNSFNDDLATFGGATANHTLSKPGMSVLELPSHNQRVAKHLRKPEDLLDSFPLPPNTPPRSPLIPRADNAASANATTSKDKKRPTLRINIPDAPHSRSVLATQSDAEEVRKEFLDASFAPRAVASQTSTPGTSRTAVPRTAMHTGFRGILRAVAGARRK